MKIAVDTNVLVRAVVQDDPVQAQTAARILEEATLIAVALPSRLAGDCEADGVIAYEGEWLGGETFVSFDKSAITLLTTQGRSARSL